MNKNDPYTTAVIILLVLLVLALIGAITVIVMFLRILKFLFGKNKDETEMYNGNFSQIYKRRFYKTYDRKFINEQNDLDRILMQTKTCIRITKQR